MLDQESLLGAMVFLQEALIKKSTELWNNSDTRSRMRSPYLYGTFIKAIKGTNDYSHDYPEEQPLLCTVEPPHAMRLNIFSSGNALNMGRPNQVIAIKPTDLLPGNLHDITVFTNFMRYMQLSVTQPLLNKGVFPSAEVVNTLYGHDIIKYHKLFGGYKSMVLEVLLEKYALIL